MQHISRSLEQKVGKFITSNKWQETYNRNLEELSKADNLEDRQEYANCLQYIIEREEAYNKEMPNKKREEKLSKLKTRLLNYDIYQQKVPYTCPVCHETECICHELGLSTKSVEEEIKEDLTQESLARIF